MDVSRAYSRHWTPAPIDFVVDNLDVEAARVVACGAVRESECNQWNGSRCITFSDPFGHGFCLISFDRKTYGGASNAAELKR
ncbi:VOC family protein [Salinisphaera sp. C84B14]|uniref:VOC family protein n=1 Tax=Salinisphaera sp. C84B14 TaxID=1304155 RepID=UPI00333EBDAF